ncbi:MAG: helix-turn-helix transcriptional regulator [Pseudomonadota bacterium]
MSPEPVVVFAIQLAGVTVAAVAFLTFFLQRHLSPFYGVSACMSLAFGLSYLVHLARFLAPDLSFGALHAIHMLSYAATFFIVPAFYFQVMLLTGRKRALSWRWIRGHLVLPAFAASCALMSLLVSPDVLGRIHSSADLAQEAASVQFIVGVLLLLEPVGYAQWLVYIGLIFHVQIRHRARLTQVFASNERYEMLWVSGMAAVLGFYALASLFSYARRVVGHENVLSPAVDSATVLLFICLLMVGALRQAPGLHAAQRATRAADPGGAKYSKSALAEDQSRRIANKLRQAMDDQHLYRDPNLSLTRLSQHIGSSSNYVSQTLNEHLGQSFFDFVNKWRIDEAKALLLRADSTILEIAYEVGFNSRSAFYTAFKKHTGVTPSQFRARGAAVDQTVGDHLASAQAASS